MEKRNFFTSGWLFMILAIVNTIVATFLGIGPMSHPWVWTEIMPLLCMLFMMSVALGIVAIFIPRGKIGMKRLLTIIFSGLAATLYMGGVASIIAHMTA